MNPDNEINNRLAFSLMKEFTKRYLDVLKKARSRDVPDITFNFFNAGETAREARQRDLHAMPEGVALSRNISNSAFISLQSLTSNGPGPFFTRRLPGASITTQEALKSYIASET